MSNGELAMPKSVDPDRRGQSIPYGPRRRTRLIFRRSRSAFTPVGSAGLNFLGLATALAALEITFRTRRRRRLRGRRASRRKRVSESGAIGQPTSRLARSGFTPMTVGSAGLNFLGLATALAALEITFRTLRRRLIFSEPITAARTSPGVRTPRRVIRCAASASKHRGRDHDAD